MFTRITPQQVRDSTGFIVQVGSRNAVQYLYGDLIAEVEADMLCQIVPIYFKTLTLYRADGSLVTPTVKEREIILERIRSGLEFLGIKYEICE